MRRVTHGDVVTAARALLATEPAQRPQALVEMIRAAQAADRYTRRFRRPHPFWVDGTLAAAAWCPGLPVEPTLGNPAYLDCLIAVLCALRQPRDHPRTQEMQRGSVGSRSSRSIGISSPQSVQ